MKLHESLFKKPSRLFSHWLNKATLFRHYKDECLTPHLSESGFYLNFDVYFGADRVDKSLPHLKISKYSSHSICKTCQCLNNMRRQSKTENDLKRAADLKNQHMKVVGDARRVVQDLK